jgi:hypothetical protein
MDSSEGRTEAPATCSQMAYVADAGGEIEPVWCARSDSPSYDWHRLGAGTSQNGRRRRLTRRATCRHGLVCLHGQDTEVNN